MPHRWRVPIAWSVLFVLYQSAEGVGDRWLHWFAVQASLMILCLLAAWPLSRWLGWRGYGAYALQWRPLRGWLWLAAGLLLATLAKTLAVAIGLHLGVYRSAGGELAWTPWSIATLGLLLAGTFVPSLAEDILTRGFWYRAAGIRWRRGWIFVICSSVLYVVNHLYRLALGPYEWLMLFCYGTAYATALWRSGSLWAALGLHWGWNLANGLLAYDTLDVRGGQLLSAVAHLGLLLIVLLLPAAPRVPAEPPAQA